MVPSFKNHNLSIQDIADMAGVSKTTVSFIINGKAEEYQISSETIQKVQDIIEKVQFAPNEFARGFRLKQTKTIGFVVGDVNNRFLSLLEKAIEIETRNHGFNLIIASSDDDPNLETKVIQTLLSKSIDGLILVSVHQNNQIHRQLNRRQIPMIYVDRILDGNDIIYVASDNFSGSYQLTELFAKQVLKKIAFIGGIETISSNSERFRGYLAALKAHHIPHIPDLTMHGEFTVEGGYRTARHLLTEKRPQPDAILTASYTLLEGFLQYVKESDITWIHKVKLATFDDHPLLDFLPFKINSVLQDAETLGKTAFDLVIRAIQGENNLQSVKISPKLIIRDQQ